MVRPPDSWRFSLSAFPIPENPTPTPSAGVRIISHVSSAQAKPLIRLAPKLCAEIRISHRLLNRISEALVEGIAEAPDRADGVGAAALVESFPQAAHENIDRALIYVGVLTPDIGEKLLSVEHAPRRLHQVFEKAELGRAKMDLLTGAADAPCLAVEFEVAGAQRGADGVRVRSAQGGSHAGHQFGDGEGLHHVVVRAGGEAPDAVDLLTPRREYDDRQVLCFGARPEPAAEFDAGDAGQHPVQQDEVGRALFQPDFRLVAAGDGFDQKTLLFEVVAEEERQGLLVLHNEDADAHSAVSAARADQASSCRSLRRDSPVPT